MDISPNSPYSSSTGHNLQGVQQLQPPQNDHYGGLSDKPWRQYHVKAVSRGCEQDGLSVRNMSDPSTITEAGAVSTNSGSRVKSLKRASTDNTEAEFVTRKVVNKEPSTINENIATETPIEWFPVPACPSSVHDTPQGNLGHELKELLTSVVNCGDKQQPLPVSDYKAFIKYFGKLPPDAAPDQLDSEAYLIKIKKNPLDIKEVPQEKLTLDVCVQACRIFPYADSPYLPDRLKTDEFYRALALEKYEALISVPDEIKRQWLYDGFFDVLIEKNQNFIDLVPQEARTDALFELACKKSPQALEYYPENKPISDHLLITAIKHFGVLKFCPDHKKTAELCEVAVRRNGSALKYVPEKFKTAALCQMAVDNDPKAIHLIPEAMITFEMCLAASKGGQIPLKRLDFLTEAQQIEIYRTAFACGESSTFMHTPEHFITDDFLKSVCTSKEYRYTPLNWTEDLNLQRLVGKDKALELYSLALSLSPEALKDVPESFRKGAILDMALSKDVSVLKYVPEENLSFDQICLKASVSKLMMNPFLYSNKQDLRNQLIMENKLPYVPTDMQLAFLTCPSVTREDKLRFIDSLDFPSYTFPNQVMTAPLICQKSPLEFLHTNLFLIPLISTAHQVTGFTLPNAAVGESINRYIARHMPSSFRLQDIPEGLSPANASAIRTVGGRTIQCLKTDGQATYFKFQRAGEPLEILAREGLLYQVIANTPGLAFKSELPQYQAFMQLPLSDELISLIGDFDDPVEIITRDGQKYINVFSYTAPDAYHCYAHSPEAEGDCPRERPEQGILMACHDAGYMISMGLVPTSMLQCLHDTESGRGWVALHAAMNRACDRAHDSVYSGTLGAWNTLATDKIDFGYCGMRDLGDYETFGDIQSCLRQKDTSDHCYPPKVSQRIALANSICEIILSAVLVRSRLRQGESGYHYKNPQALKETASFVESACNQFLSGLMPMPDTRNQLQSLLGREEHEYQAWLNRVAQEVLYWTALQPVEPGFDQLAKGEYDPTDCYLNHIGNDKHLCETLYPVGAYTLLGQRDFFNINDQLNLGGNNTSLPLLSLLNGLTVMNTGILELLNH